MISHIYNICVRHLQPYLSLYMHREFKIFFYNFLTVISIQTHYITIFVESVF